MTVYNPITKYHVNSRTFYIVKKDEYYLAIEDKYIDENGKLNKRLNGIQMNASKDMNTTIERTRKQVEVDRLVAECGFTLNEALVQAFGI